MKRFSSGMILSLLLLFAGCAAHTNIEPLGRGNMNANLSLGGPVVAAFNTHIPIPYATLGAAYGLKDDINIDASFHLTSLPYRILGMDLGAAYFPVVNNGFIPTVGIHPGVLAFFSMKPDVESRMRLYPSGSASAAWHLGSDMVYSGFDYTLPLTTPDYDTDAPRFVLSPFLGYRTDLGKDFRLTTELKWQGANVRTNQLAADYTKLGGHGAVAILFVIERSF
ncbi:MAG TPA: hypothetical protein VHO03_19915 [Ignavibacteriales bacterium]|nr:hypothetical protein [Ignavibacteriales bacterium]